jgi:hypothetical protein
MAVSFPLSTADFFDLLPVPSVKFFPKDHRQFTGLGGGEILSAELAPTLWEGRCELPEMRSRDAAVIETQLSVLSQVGASFFAYKKTQIGPRHDPMGDQLDGFSPVVAGVNYGDATLSIGGLPPGYRLAHGDLVSFAYGASPVRYGLHRLGAEVVASADGETPYFSVAPYLRPGLSAGGQITLVKPFCKAVIIPQSINFGDTFGTKTSGISFDFRQTLR